MLMSTDDVGAAGPGSGGVGALLGGVKPLVL